MEAEQSHVKGRAQAIVHYFGKLDMFRVVQDQENCLTSATTAGTIVSTITAFFIAVLMVQETYFFFKGSVRSSMFVPSPKVKQEDMEPVHLIVSFPDMPCDVVGMAIVDQHGNMLPDLMRPSTVFRTRLDPDNKKREIGVYKDGPVDPKEGCRVIGTIMIDKVPGHFLLGALAQRGGSGRSANPHYILHEMWIGNVRLDKGRDAISEDLVNPLRNHTALNDPQGTMHKFYMQVVPTYFRNDRNGKVKKLGYQYTVSNTKVMAPHMPPGLYFSHKHSTLAVEYRYHYESWSHFFVNLCAIVGGVFTVMSFISSAMEALGDTPTVAKAMNFFANYVAGRRRAPELHPRATSNPGIHAALSAPLHTPNMPMMHSTATPINLKASISHPFNSTTSTYSHPTTQSTSFQSMGSYGAYPNPTSTAGTSVEQRFHQPVVPPQMMSGSQHGPQYASQAQGYNMSSQSTYGASQSYPQHAPTTGSVSQQQQYAPPSGKSRTE